MSNNFHVIKDAEVQKDYFIILKKYYIELTRYYFQILLKEYRLNSNI